MDIFLEGKTVYDIFAYFGYKSVNFLNNLLAKPDPVPPHMEWLRVNPSKC